MQSNALLLIAVIPWIVPNIPSLARSETLTQTTRERTITVAAVVMFALVPLVLVTPLHPDPTTTLVLLAVTSFGFGMLNGLPGTALQSVVPNQLRGQIIAAYFLIGTMMSLGSGPTLVAWVSDHLLGGPMQIGVSLATVGAVFYLALFASASQHLHISWFILFFFPLLGSMVYGIAVWLPEFRMHRGVRRASSTHGSSAASDSSDHMPSETRQSKRSATGTASSAGTIVPACSTVM